MFDLLSFRLLHISRATCKPQGSTGRKHIANYLQDSAFLSHYGECILLFAKSHVLHTHRTQDTAHSTRASHRKRNRQIKQNQKPRQRCTTFCKIVFAINFNVNHAVGLRLFISFLLSFFKENTRFNSKCHLCVVVSNALSLWFSAYARLYERIYIQKVTKSKIHPLMPQPTSGVALEQLISAKRQWHVQRHAKLNTKLTKSHGVDCRGRGACSSSFECRLLLQACVEHA